MNNTKQRKEIRKPPLDYVGEKPILDCREQSTAWEDDRIVDRGFTDCRDSKASWRRSRIYQSAAEARHWPRKHGSLKEAEARKNLGGGTGCSRFRSGFRM